jgi:hypothetical protein
MIEMESTRPLGQMVGGAAIGAGAALAGSVLGLWGLAAALLVMIVVGILLPHYGFLAGGLLGLGSTCLWLLSSLCPAGDCGNSNPLPLAAMSLLLLTAGAGLAVLTYLRHSPN